MRHLQQVAGEADEILEPKGLESQLGAQLPQLRCNRVVQEVIARDDGDRRGRQALAGLRPKLSEKAQAVNERHPQIEDDRVWMGLVRGAETGLGIKRGPNVEAFERQHARKRLRDTLVIVYDEDGRNLLCSFGS